MKNIFIICFCSVMFNIVAIEYNTYEMQKVHIFSASNLGLNNSKDLGIVKNPGAGQEVGPGLYFEDKSLVIIDQANKNSRTIILNDEYSFNEIYNKSFYASRIIFLNNFILGYGISHISLLNKQTKEFKFWISADDISFLRRYKDLYYQDNTLFIFDENNKLWAIKNPGLDNNVNKRNIVKEDDIIKEIKDGNYEGLTIDNEKRLFLNGELQTISSEVFINYWVKKRSLNDKPQEQFDLPEKVFITGHASFIGSDKDGNKYWYQGGGWIVYNKKGWPIDIFLASDWEAVHSIPTVSPNGDVYFLNYGSDKVTLYKIPRQW